MTFNRSTTLLLLALMTTPLAEAAETPPHGITVEGVCNRRTVPDRGAITVTADALAPDVASAVSEATRAYEKVRSGVKKLSLENLDIETAEYSVREERAWEKDHQVSKGFRARMGLRITSSSIEKLGEVIAIAARAEIRDVGALNTYLSPEKLRQEQLGCLEDASAHARAKAEKLAAALGVKVGPVTNVTELRTELPNPVPMMAMGRSKHMAEDAAAPGVEAGKQDLSTTIQATFSLR